MNTIAFPLKRRARGNAVAQLHRGLQALFLSGHLKVGESDFQSLEKQIRVEQVKKTFGPATHVLVASFQKKLRIRPNGVVDARTAEAMNQLLAEGGAGKRATSKQPELLEIKGTVKLADGLPASGIKLRAVIPQLRGERPLRHKPCHTNIDGAFLLTCSAPRKRESDRLALVIQAMAMDGSTLATSPRLVDFSSSVELTIPAEQFQPPPLFDRIGSRLSPLLGRIRLDQLEENEKHQDVTFLADETGFSKAQVARYLLAHRLPKELPPVAWFVVLGSSSFEYNDSQSLTSQLITILDALTSIDANAARKSFVRGFGTNEISSLYEDKVGNWIEELSKFAAGWSIGGASQPTFVKLALDEARIKGTKKREKFARLLNEHGTLTSELLDTLAGDASFKKSEIADLQTSYQIAELTQADFSVVKMIKDEFDVREPARIRSLARKSEDEWANLIEERHAVGEIRLPVEVEPVGGHVKLPDAKMFGRSLASTLRTSFPTTAFAGGLERALGNGGAHGLKHAGPLSRYLNHHEDFEFLSTPIDEFLKNKTHPDFAALVKDEGFRSELKAVQRVFKLAPDFKSTDTLLADGVHSAQMIYRLGESEFVRRYGDRMGFTVDTAHMAWRRAADTHAAVATIIGDLKALDVEALPAALMNNNAAALSTFPNWINLFQTGDICECEHCRSVLSPAAYFADILMFLKDRRAANPADSVKDILLRRRPDLGYLELNCENALTPLPYVDVVCEVLEAVVAAGESDVELNGFTNVPAGTAAAKAAVAAALSSKSISVGVDFSLSQVDPANPDLWVAHGDDATYLLKKKGTANFFAEVLRNTKATAAELRAYPQYVNTKAYEKLARAKYPLLLPFDLFASEVRAGFQKCNLQRWNLLWTLRGSAAPHNPSDGDIAAEYFGISADPAAGFDEKRLILVANPTVAGQKEVWGEVGNADWLGGVNGAGDPIKNSLRNVKYFLQKTGLEYNELLALIDLKFISPAQDITIQHLDSSCDLEKKLIVSLDETKLDRINRFLRLFRKLKGWKAWELDLVVRHPRIGAIANPNGALDEPFLINLFYFCRIKSKLGTKVTVEQVAALFGNLNIETRYTKLHEKRADALYQNLFLNKRLIKPLDLAFEVAKVNVPGPTAETITTHQPVVLGVLGLREADLMIFKGLTKASDNLPYITDDLTLTNLSFLWRQSWLSKQLKLKAEDWKNVLKLLHQDVLHFADTKAAWEYLEKIDQLNATGFTPDELNWFLSADRTAKAATKESEAARFLATLRKELQSVQSDFDPASNQFDFLNAAPPTDTERLTTLLSSLLQKLNRDEAATQFFIATLRDELNQEKTVAGLPAGFDFPAPIKSTIRIRYDEPTSTLRFGGVMTVAQKATLLGDPSLAAVTANAAYVGAINEFFAQPRLALKFFNPVFVSPLEYLPAAVDFKLLADASLASKISYDAEQRLLQCAGFLSTDDKLALDALSADTAYRAAVSDLFTKPNAGVFPPDQIWLQDGDLTFPLRQPGDETNDNLTLATNFATASTKALKYLLKTFSENAVVKQSSTALGLTESVTRRLLTEYALLPNSFMTHLTGPFAATNGVVDYATATLKPTFDGWFWASRVAKVLNKWKLTLPEWETITKLTTASQLVDFLTWPLDSASPASPVERFIRSCRLLRLRDSLPETDITLLDLLEKISEGDYKAEANAPGLPAGFAFPASITGAPNNIPVQFDAALQLMSFSGLMTVNQRTVLLTDASLAAVTNIAAYQQAINGLFTSLNRQFAEDVQGLAENWLADDVQTLTSILNLSYPSEYMLAESWERLRRAFYYLDNLNARAHTVSGFVKTAMSAPEAQTLKELLRSKFGEETWLALSTEIQDALREQKRDALAAYLLTQAMPADAPSGKWENTNDLYALHLLDVEMCSCQLTSRLVQGSGSVQLFVQRCFMGLEPKVKVKADGDDGDSAWRWWKWMRKYRVWEANRKVWLWPENWIEPELKKDRSQFFKDLETELLQNEINQFTVETAFTNYLEKLDGVKQLEIAGFFQEDDADETILHVFGRTIGAEPHLYYYRRYDYRQWTPWEKVELDIQGDHLVPVVLNKRLFLFWPVFSESPDEENNKKMKVPDAGDDDFEPTPAKKILRLQMAVSEYRQGKWTPKKVSRDYHEWRGLTGEIVKSHYVFWPVDRTKIDGRAGIRFNGGSFEISGCNGTPVKGSLHELFWHALRPERASVGNVTRFLKWVELESNPPRSDSPENDFALQSFNPLMPKPGFQSSTVLKETPWVFKMSPPWHLSYLDKLWLNGQSALGVKDKPDKEKERGYPAGSWLPFFYNDRRRTFFILPLIWRRKDKPTSGFATEMYYPDIKRIFRAKEDYAEGQLQNALAAFKPAALTAADRKKLEQSLEQEFPKQQYADMPPRPYSDDQIKNLIKQLLMRDTHHWLAKDSLTRFHRCRFHFKNFYHPFVCDFAKLVYNPLKGIRALMSRETQLKDTGFSFRRTYQPTPRVLAPTTEMYYPQEVVDFTPDGAYSPYNWELFFLAPLMIANQLSKNQRFEEARDWYHYIFNPVGVESPVPGGSEMSKYWITKPFFQTTDPQYIQQRIDNILLMLAGDTTVPGYSPQVRKDIEDQVRDWRTNPFEPHRIANYRTVAYQKNVVMKYLDNLIAWGDYLFRQDSMESINEATQLYVLAAEILGPRPKKVPPRIRPPVESFNELEDEFDKFSNALVEVENLIPPSPGTGEIPPDSAPIPMLYFCIPQNEKLLGYWDTIADRLYKIRHCMNIEGVVRQLALFEPPIDPAALVKAVAAGLDISAALADLNAPLPLYRFNTLLQKANEVCNDVKALGGALLSALEKKDGEAIGLLRQSQEIKLLNAVKVVREKQIEEAKENLNGLKKGRELAQIKQKYYDSREFMNAGETAALVLSSVSLGIHTTGTVLDILGGVLAAVPDFNVGASGFGGSPHAAVKTGGASFSKAVELAARALYQTSTILDKSASIANTVGNYQRRQEEWIFQGNLASKEIEQLDRSIAAAELRIAIAEKELENQIIQIDNSKATNEFMHSKFTNQELYQWQVGQISGVYFQSYKLAYDLAKRAERCFRFELGLQDSSYVNFGYWDSLKKGLLSGEKLQYDLRRLEAAYLEQNRREFELTKHVSLALLDPLALVRLRETGKCFFRLPEEMLDLDYPGHYFRRIKSVSITLPCVTGPYTTVSCTLRLLKNSIRINTAKGDNGYPRNTDDQGLPADDGRFIENNVPVKAIAASGAQNDSGVFELNFQNDPRYLPFEGAGVMSEWALELFSDLPANNPDPANPDFGEPLRQFDYGTISDAIIQVKYTAREDAGPFKNGAVTHLRNHYGPNDETPSYRMLNLRQEFPSQWYRFLNPTNPANGNIFELELSPQLFSLRDAGKTLKVNALWLFARCTDAGNYKAEINQVIDGAPPVPLDPGINAMPLALFNQYGRLHFTEKDTTALGVELAPINSSTIWHMKMSRPGGGILVEDPVKKIMEVEDLILVLGYEWK